MSGVHNGVHALIQSEYPAATYMHCVAHCMNLTITSASKIIVIRNAFNTITKITNLFRNSVKRSNVFVEAAKAMGASKLTLSRLSDTRWVERLDGILTFTELYEAIMLSLDQISTWTHDSAAPEASCLQIALSRHEFVIALQTLKHVLGNESFYLEISH